MRITNLSVKQKYKDINPIILQKINELDKNFILSNHLKEFIAKHKFSITELDIQDLKKKLNKYQFNESKILKIILDFIKYKIKPRYLVINFEVHFNDYFIQVIKNSINLYQEDFKLLDSDIDCDENEEFLNQLFER
jgi:hypothetical protein